MSSSNPFEQKQDFWFQIPDCKNLSYKLLYSMWGFVADLSSISSEEELQFVQVYIKKVTEIDALLRGKFNFDITEQIIPYSQQISELDDSSSSSSYEFQEKYNPKK